MGNLKEVTYLTLKELKKYEIVLPKDYTHIFQNYAKDLDLDVENEELVNSEIKQEYSHMQNIVKETSENISTIKDSTSSAKEAIINKDEKSLEQILENLTKMQEKIDYLQKELFSDALTKAYNRKWFLDHFLENDTFQNNGYLCFIDVNKFKSINDNYGHIVGDQVLKYLVRFLQTNIDIKGAKVVRYAGDEFMVLFDDSINKVVIEKTIKESQKKISTQKLKSSKVEALYFSFAYGLVNFKKNDTLENIINEADELMYKNKKSGA